jgi:hypothetical protein
MECLSQFILLNFFIRHSHSPYNCSAQCATQTLSPDTGWPLQTNSGILHYGLDVRASASSGFPTFVVTSFNALIFRRFAAGYDASQPAVRTALLLRRSLSAQASCVLHQVRLTAFVIPLTKLSADVAHFMRPKIVCVPLKRTVTLFVLLRLFCVCIACVF